MVYDVTDRKTFEALPSWIEEIRKFADPSCKIMILGNKCDEIEKKVH